MPISISVNVDKLDKTKLFKGKKGRYLDLILFEAPEDSKSAEYGDYIVKQRGEKDEKLPILGNGKYFKPKDRAGRKSSKKEEEEDGDNGDIF